MSCENNLCDADSWMNGLGWTCVDYEVNPANCSLPPWPEYLSPCGTSAQEACCVCGGGGGEDACISGKIKDCNNNCCPESYIGDGFCDGEDMGYGCDFSCATFSCDGGDCVDECGVCNGPGPPCKRRKKRLDPITRQRGGRSRSRSRSTRRQRGGRIRRQQGGRLPKPWNGK